MRESLGEASSVAKGKCHTAGSAGHPFQPCLSQPATSLSAHTTTLKKCPHSATSASCSLEGPPAPGSCPRSDVQLFLWILAPSLQMAFVWDPLGVTVAGPSPRIRTRLRFSKSYRYGNFLSVAAELFASALGPLQVNSVGPLNSRDRFHCQRLKSELTYCKHSKWPAVCGMWEPPEAEGNCLTLRARAESREVNLAKPPSQSQYSDLEKSKCVPLPNQLLLLKSSPCFTVR